MNPRPSTNLVAFAAAGVVIVVCGVVTAGLLFLRDLPFGNADPGGSAFPFDPGPETYLDQGDYYPDTQTYPTAEPSTETVPVEESTSDSTTSGLLDGFEQVSGPASMTTLIPSGWPTSRASGPGAMQADDVSGGPIVLRYGGSVTPDPDTYRVHADYEQQFAATRSGYSLIHLDRSTVRGMPAVDWEFEYHPENDVRRHVRSVYWLSQDIDYFVYASAPVEEWPRAQEILDVMLDNATP